ncbi:MAG: phosphatase PAP2 family protein [Deltaproteobacteria bacterium]|nr:phosphatase PAP2 family protein [Deltaproteobacteria bacterium]
MNIFDSSIIFYVNGLSRHFLIFDHLMGFLAHNPLLKGGVLATLIWWMWFKSGQSDPHGREHIISTVFGCLVAIALARALALTLPFRVRPMHELGLNFVLPYGVDQSILDDWSSFPSDHAVLFFSLSAGLLFLSKKVGVLTLAYTALFIVFPRVYLGLHYPTDVIAGAVIGIAVGCLGNLYLVRSNIFRSAVRWLDSRPSVFYPLFFLLTYQIADLFSSGRGLLKGAWKLLKIMLA